MFQSIQYIVYEGYRDELFYHRYLITDSDFVEGVVGAGYGRGADADEDAHPAAGAGAVLICYSSRHLDVAYNLYLYHKYMAKKFRWYDINANIEWHAAEVPQYEKYIQEIKRYVNSYNNMKAFW